MIDILIKFLQLISSSKSEFNTNKILQEILTLKKILIGEIFL